MRRALSSEQTSQPLFLDRHMQINTGDAHVGMSGSIADLGEGTSTGQSVADKCVVPVVDRERL